MRVLVTGGASGIGRAIADVDTISSSAGFSSSITDCADPETVDHMFGDLESSLGGLDVLVDNVGISGPTGPIESLDPRDWQRTLAVNVGGHFLCSRRAVPLLRDAGGGSIVNISSTAGTLGYPLRVPYAVSKWGVVSLTKSLAMELGDDGIRVDAICPGPVDGPRMSAVIEREAAATGLGAEVLRDAYTDARRIPEARLCVDV